MLNHIKRITINGTAKIIIIFAVITVLLIASGFIVSKIVYDSIFSRKEAPSYSAYLMYEDVKSEYPYEEVTLISGANQLSGYIYGTGNEKGIVVVAQGLGNNAGYLSDVIYFVDAGWQVFIYDCTGTNRSEGNGTVSFFQSVLDLDAALTYIEAQPWNLPVMLYGHSWGGYAVAAVLNYEHEVSAVASIAGYNTPSEALNDQIRRVMGGFSAVILPFADLYQSTLSGSAKGFSAVGGINNVDTPVMVIHGSDDPMFLYNGAAIIAHKDEITNPNIVFITLDKPGFNGHNSIFYSPAKAAYFNNVNQEYEELERKYNGNVSEEAEKAFFAGVDKYLMSENDPDFMARINEFFNGSLLK